ncbi:hypothetical protein TRIATDRAFT_315275 [Trichoderma atroviride IMI 206040]|uniref:Uncharacterized protein n=1 Tax=Hypocrea atroviridis (strain ATCC 20476 / IMI 206040) TaxID=452589 RepID=G9NJ11_HYPAI|nr:uncharacterized protein TRIATDRAFT_315275 [Trichoderma atroviride IMI 206040]EHK48888.1 hypothetical protein TRIATDRAFT_315275 [Trichoderma atroviride IMI 206040]
MPNYRYPGRHVPYRPDRITLPADWLEDQEKMGREEARTQKFQGSVSLHDVTHHSTRDSGCPDERNGQAGLDSSQPNSGQSMLDGNQSDDTDEVGSDVLEGPNDTPTGAYNDTEEVYIDAVEELRNTLGGAISENDNDDAYTDVLESLRDNIGEADNDTASNSKTDCIFLPACGIVFFGAVLKKEGSLLVAAMHEYFQEAKGGTCSSSKEEIPVDIQLPSSQKNENTLGDESRDNNTHLRFITHLGGEGTLLMNQQTMCSSLHRDSCRKRTRTEDLEIEVQEPESKICRLE